MFMCVCIMYYVFSSTEEAAKPCMKVQMLILIDNWIELK